MTERALVLLNSLSIVGPNMRHEEQGMWPDGKHSEDNTWDGPGWCVCRRVWPCEAKELGDVILALLEERRVLRGGGKVVTAYWKGTRLLERDALLHLAMRRHEHSNGCDGCLNVQRQIQAALDDAPVSEVLDEDRLARALASPDAMAALSRFGDGVTTTDDIADAILAALRADPARAEEGAETP